MTCYTVLNNIYYVTGFGSKMLSKMGWRAGQGLGSKGAGIVNPVKATKHTDFGKGFSHMQLKKVYMYMQGCNQVHLHVYRTPRKNFAHLIFCYKLLAQVFLTRIMPRGTQK